ncbi:MAG: hypothetical protein HYY18_17760 [Planctomycetes bacterium]|nr:hypothetical protein [Planctomycetota bacterium]
MREVTNAERIRAFMESVGRDCQKPARVYFTGGACAVLLGWRQATLDVDIRIEADSDAVFQLLPKIKEALHLNVELASPSDFIPELPGWRDRCVFVAREGRVDFFHYDFYAQALAKTERGHTMDLQDVGSMIRSGLVEPPKAMELFARIEPDLPRYPALDPSSFRKAVEKMFGRAGPGAGQ